MGFFSDLFGGGSSSSTSSTFELKLDNETLEDGSAGMVFYMKGTPFAEFSDLFRLLFMSHLIASARDLSERTSTGT